MKDQTLTFQDSKRYDQTCLESFSLNLEFKIESIYILI